MRGVWLVWVAIFVGVAACVAVILDEPSHVAKLGFADGMMNADMLWPASFVWDVTTRGDGWRGHSLSRLPSLFPDVTVWGSLALITRSVRWTILLYGVLQASAFVTIGGWLAARFAGRTWVAGASAVFAVMASLVALALAHVGGRLFVSSEVLPIIHFGPMLLSLLAAALVARWSSGVGSTWAILGVSILVFLSDELLLIEFVLPLLFASVGLCAAGRMLPSRALGRAVTLVAGTLIGRQAIIVLRHAGVHLDHQPFIEGAAIIRSIHKFVADVPRLIAGQPIFATLVAIAAVTFVGIGWWIAVQVNRQSTDRTVGGERMFLWLFAAATTAGAIVFTACFYDDATSLRYLVAVWAWGVVALAAAALRIPGAAYAATPVAALTVGVSLFEYAVVDHGAVAVLNWDLDVAACVRSRQGPLDLHAGLAGYWVARPAEMALRWSTQIDQVTPTGIAYPWNSDALWFRESLADPARPPVYDFIVMRELDTAAIVARYGRPDTVVPCADTALWVYRDRAALSARVAETWPPPDLKHHQP